MKNIINETLDMLAVIDFLVDSTAGILEDQERMDWTQEQMVEKSLDFILKIKDLTNKNRLYIHEEAQKMRLKYTEDLK